MNKNFRSSKIIVSLGIALFIVVTLGIGTTTAYFKDQSQKVVNEFTVGNVTTEIVEIFNKKNNHEYEKRPRVTNTGMNSCYIRMRFEVTPEEMGKRIKFSDLPGNGWKKSGEWYYYENPVEPGQSTSELFTGITVEYNEADKPWKDFDILLYQEAVQAEVFADNQSITDAGTIWAQYDAQ